MQSDVVSMSAGTNHSLFAKQDLTLWGSGRNSDGSLGQGDSIERWWPVKIDRLNLIPELKGIAEGEFLSGSSHIFDWSDSPIAVGNWRLIVGSESGVK